MGRAVIEETNVDEERCAWKCPCGGTVPDTPRWCEHRKEREWGHFCTDAVICGHYCTESKDCDAFIEFKRRVTARRADDIKASQANKKEE